MITIHFCSLLGRQSQVNLQSGEVMHLFDTFGLFQTCQARCLCRAIPVPQNPLPGSRNTARLCNC